MLQVRNLHKRYVTARGQVLAVRGVSFDVRDGEFLTLLGPSGCGKTTMLRCIAGLETPDAGEIRIGATTVFSSAAAVDVPIERRDIGMVFQSYAIWPHMTVYQNVAFPLRVGKPRPPSAELEQRVHEALRLVQLDALADRPVPQLSGGQQQRVALARALVRRPRLLLLDEPLSNLDARLGAQMREEIVEVASRAGVATVYVTHDQVEALAMSDRILVLLDGAVVQEGTPDTIYTAPRSRFVAEFVGASNLIEGEIVAASGESTTVQTALGTLTGQRTDGLRPGERVYFCTRPEDTAVLRAPPADGANVLPAEVTRVTFLGDHRQCWARAGSALLCARLPSQADLRAGETIYLHLPPARSLALPWEAAPAEAQPTPA
ncbi:MAG TPA: ABC transporter ATP-binding protein [Chloroflexota bacterium]|nr:ABC transporter ATP-binding protein [Chloroflexota bacterium]